MKIYGIDNWDQFGNYIFTPSSVVFRNCIFTIFDSGELQGEDLENVAIRSANSVTIFDNCEFTNITVDYTDYCCGDGYGGAVRFSGEGTLLFNRSNLTNITVKRTDPGYIHGAVLSVISGTSANVELLNTIVADNTLSYENNESGYNPSGGAIWYQIGRASCRERV